MKDGPQDRQAQLLKRTGLKLLHPDFNIKLFESIATLFGACSQ
jgi:hypothetical protein